MLELLALALEDGWAYVRRDGVIQFARPPYRKDACHTVAESAVEDAVTKHGFMASTETFDEWDHLTSYVRQRVEETQPDVPSAEEIGRAYWEVAEKRDLALALDHVEQDLAPTGKHEHAKRLLRAMTQFSPVLPTDGDLMARAVGLQAEVQDQLDATRKELLAVDTSASRLATKLFSSAEERDTWLASLSQRPSGSSAMWGTARV